MQRLQICGGLAVCLNVCMAAPHCAYSSHSQVPCDFRLFFSITLKQDACRPPALPISRCVWLPCPLRSSRQGLTTRIEAHEHPPASPSPWLRAPLRRRWLLEACTTEAQQPPTPSPRAAGGLPYGSP